MLQNILRAPRPAAHVADAPMQSGALGGGIVATGVNDVVVVEDDVAFFCAERDPVGKVRGVRVRGEDALFGVGADAAVGGGDQVEGGVWVEGDVVLDVVHSRGDCFLGEVMGWGGVGGGVGVGVHADAQTDGFLCGCETKGDGVAMPDETEWRRGRNQQIEEFHHQRLIFVVRGVVVVVVLVSSAHQSLTDREEFRIEIEPRKRAAHLAWCARMQYMLHAPYPLLFCVGRVPRWELPPEGAHMGPGAAAGRGGEGIGGGAKAGDAGWGQKRGDDAVAVVEEVGAELGEGGTRAGGCGGGGGRGFLGRSVEGGGEGGAGGKALEGSGGGGFVGVGVGVRGGRSRRLGVGAGGWRGGRGKECA